MAKPKFTLNPAPTFKAKVAVPVPGSASADVEFIFKHRTRDELREFIDALSGRDDVDVVMSIASGWDLDDAFDTESIGKLTQNYIGSARVVIDTYLSELSGARLGN